MCGICGTAGFTDEAVLRSMCDVIAHRGPDDDGVYISAEARVGLGSRRLSIIDLSSAGHMPMSNEDSRIWVVQNGEIYNFPELREQLIGKGHCFRSRSDTEVLIHGYEEWGTGLFAKLNGMFACAILDLRNGSSPARAKLVLARDRFGIKPLYFTTWDRQLAFSSEIKSLLLIEGIRREVNPQALHKLLSFLWIPNPQTLFAGIECLRPGHFLTWENGNATIEQYWDLRFDPNERIREGEAIEELRSILYRSVKRHLISDVPVGVFLSGGIDSSAVLAYATQVSGAGVNAYTIAYRAEDARLEQSGEDAKFARLAAHRFNADYHEIVVEPKITELLPKIIWHLDSPVADPAAIGTFLISDAARSKVKVLLSGQAADEIFAGYRVHLTHRLAERVRLVPKFLRNTLGKQSTSLLRWSAGKAPGIHPGLLLAGSRYIDKLLAITDLPPEQRYILARSYASDSDLGSLYSDDFAEQIGSCRAGESYERYFAAGAATDFINQLLYVDAKTFLVDLNLAYCDKLSSAASVEVRVPFLDAELVDFMSRLPAKWKLHGLTTKYILKKAMRGVLPDNVIDRRKAGFGAPIRKWLRSDLRDFVDDVLSESNVRRRGYFKPAEVRRLIEEDRLGTKDNTFRIWALLSFETWHKTFLDQSYSSFLTKEAANAGSLSLT